MTQSTHNKRHLLFYNLRQHPRFQLIESSSGFLEGPEGAGGGVEGGVPPLGQVDLGQDAALAGHAGVDLVIGQDHGVDLDAVHLVGVVANDSGKLDLADLGKLLQGEAAGPASVLVPEPIAESKVVELLGHQAAEGWAHHGSGQRLFGDSGGPDVDVLDGGVVLSPSVDGLVVEGAVHVLPALEGLDAAELSPPVVARDAVLASALQVEGSQIEAEVFAGFLHRVKIILYK